MTKLSPEGTIRQAYVRFGLVYWGGAFLLSVIFYALKITDFTNYNQHGLYLVAKLLRYSSSWVITSLISHALWRIHCWSGKRGPMESSLPIYIVSAFLICLAWSPVWAALAHVSKAIYASPAEAAFDRTTFINYAALGAAMLFGWSCLFISVLFSFELHERGRRLAAAREEALTAQMRALRYQVNPHFLFNTLNSIAGLIEEGSAAQAQRMVLSLSTFLRKTLSLDPLQDVPLSVEIALQQEYLEIECKRFSDRMAVSIEIPEDVRCGLVPSLILQPLIENAIKHGVCQSHTHTQISIQARQLGENLLIAVANDVQPGACGALPAAGLGIGLRNVAERIHMRFGEAGALRIDRTLATRFLVELTLPWRTS